MPWHTRHTHGRQACISLVAFNYLFDLQNANNSLFEVASEVWPQWSHHLLPQKLKTKQWSQIFMEQNLNLKNDYSWLTLYPFGPGVLPYQQPYDPLRNLRKGILNSNI